MFPVLTSPAVNAAAFHTILYVVGLEVVAVYPSVEVCALVLWHLEAAVADAVMVGVGLTVTVTVCAAPSHPPAEEGRTV